VSELPGRVLALDLGDARIGLALSDPLGITAQPVGKIDSRGVAADLRRIRALIDEHQAVEVVVGLPLRLSGEAGPRAEQAREFARRLAESVPRVSVELWDERLTTAEVERAMIRGNVRRRRRREVIDSLAAVLILQSYLDARSVRGTRSPR
jgi:putative Holliday junction resolvase